MHQDDSLSQLHQAKYMKMNPELANKNPDADSDTLLALANSARQWQPAGKLVKEGEDMRFIDSPVAAIIYDEVRAMRDIMNKDGADSESECPETPGVDENSNLLLSGDDPTVDLASLWPERGQVTRLWQYYLERVNPLIKIIHVPTLQPLVDASSWGFGGVPKNVEALLFSIFLMTVVSMTPEECKVILDSSKEEALQTFSLAVRLSLIRINFLRSSDLTVLQALMHYLVSLHGRYNRHAVWVLNGVAIRLAQKMGLHRDGTTLGLSPFETEMRRRLWWQIILVDAKYAMLSGLTHSMLPTNYDTKAPTNINDHEFGPATLQPLEGRSGPTEMVFCLLTCKFAKFLMAIPGIESILMLSDAASTTGDPKKRPTPEQQLEYRRALKLFREELLDFFKDYCDKSAGGVHEIAMTMSKHIVDMLSELGTHPEEQPDERKNEVKTASDQLFKHAVSALEHHEAGYEATKGTGFAWFTLLAFQVDLFLYVVGQLGQRLEGPMVERAWRQVGVVYTFHPDLFDLSNRVHAALALHVLTAWSRRKHRIAEQGDALVIETPFYITRLRNTLRETGFAWADEEDRHAPIVSPAQPSSLFMQDPLLGMAGLGYGSELDMIPDFGSSMAWDPFVPPMDGANVAMQEAVAFGPAPVAAAAASGNAPAPMNLADEVMDWQTLQGFGPSSGLGPPGPG
ncbi:hypothetical protein VTJ49DRAFT_6416 [Mycothermus thermophilus]|uniref:Xylanolytic transcriptional activator regulatory domain-containing protein n=1 Tax=Humicola insolens TaxID=85995 RepID=A0ABR3VJC4_HUMIN